MRKPSPSSSPAAREERRNRVIALAKEGCLTQREIGARVNLSKSAVREILRRAGMTTPRPRMTPGELAEAQRLIDEGCSLAEVARTIGRPPQTLSNYFKGWTRAQCGEWVAFCNRAFGHFDPFTGEQTKPGTRGFVQDYGRRVGGAS